MERALTTPTAQRFDLLGRGFILFAAFVALVLSVSLWFGGNHDQGVFVGLWVPSILALGGLTVGRSR